MGFILCDFIPNEVFFGRKEVKAETEVSNKLSPRGLSKAQDGPADICQQGLREEEQKGKRALGGTTRCQEDVLLSNGVGNALARPERIREVKVLKWLSASNWRSTTDLPWEDFAPERTEIREQRNRS